MFHAADELQYNDSRLAELYDTLNEWGEDNAFYMQTAGTMPVRILDAGCGTGLLAVALARAGHTVVGVDPAGAMLRVAQDRPDNHLVQWRQSTLQAFHNETLYDLIIMAGNAFQVFLTDEAMAAANAEPDPDRRRTLLVEANNIINDDCPVQVIYFTKRAHALSPDLRNYVPNQIWNPWYLPYLWIDR